MSRAQAKTVGDELEARLIEQRGLQQLDVEAIDAPDALASDDTPIEVKSCRRWISNGRGRTAGRWYLRRRAHDALLEAGGYYLLAVYEERDDELVIVDDQLIPADVVDAIVPASSWSDVRRDCEAVAKLRHSAVSSVEEGSA